MRFWSHIKRFKRNEDGAILVELALVMPVFLLLFFGLIDFSRVGFSYVMAGKATERAVRQAVVRAPLCLGVPKTNLRGTNGDTSLRFGNSCNIAGDLCHSAATVSCSLDVSTAGGADIWAEIAPLMPTNATPANLQISYQYDSDLGFLGGPYTPIVTVEIQNLNFEFVTPLGALVTLAGVSGSQTVGNDYIFPSMSASLPAEALFDGEPS